MTGFVLLCALGAAFGQRQPIEFAVHHTYTKEDGIPPGNAFTVMDQLEDGSVVMRLYGKEFVRVTPTGARPVYFGSSLKNFLITEISSTQSGRGIFNGYKNGLIRLIRDSLQAYGPPQNLIAVATLPSGRQLCVLDSAEQVVMRKYDGESYLPVPMPLLLKGFGPFEVAFIGNAPDGNIRLASKQPGAPLYVWEYIEASNALKLSAFYTDTPEFQPRLNFGNDSLIILNGNDQRMHYPAPLRKSSRPVETQFLHLGQNDMQVLDRDTYSMLKDFKSCGFGELPLDLTEMTSYIIRDRFYKSVYLGQSTHAHRVFPHVRRLGTMYAPGHSRATLTIAQQQDGTLFFGSYEGYATTLKDGAYNFIDVNRAHVLPGSMALGKYFYAFSEAPPGIMRIGKRSNEGFVDTKKNNGYFIMSSRDSSKVFTGVSMHHGIGIIARDDFEAGRPNWRYIDSTRGLRLLNVLTIAEDPQGRLWFGRISQGWGVYDPRQDTAVTYLRQEGTSTFGVMATHCDAKGTMWMGGSDGLWLADANKQGTILAQDAIKLNHPLLNNGGDVVSMTPWGRFLVFSSRQKILMLDLSHFYTHKAAVLGGKMWPLIQYLNPHEISLNPQAQWNQNSMLTDKTDSSLWVAANDNIYHIDLKTWFQLPRPYAAPELQLIAGDDTLRCPTQQRQTVPPTSNSLSFNIFYQTTDNMPRLLQVALVAAGDTARWSEPATQTHFEAWNRQTGNYTFLVRVIEHDGTINEFTFPITIRKFLWQQWWFWLLLSMLVGGVIFYYYYLYKQKQLAKAHAARLAAEAEALKADQQRQLTAMQVKSLSTQFRPHFILNALNTIGAQLYDKPDVDKILGQLGESIGIIFKNAQSGAIAHPLATEWRLVESVIQIKQLEMRQAVQVHWHVEKALMANDTYRVPMGILQIPVENALVHGLRNKEDGSRDLWIHAKLDEVNHRLCIAITDNGIGRKAAALLTNYRSNGVGSRNLQSIVELLNPLNERPITIDIEDLPLLEQRQPCGTRITICIPENYKYEH